MPRQTVHAIHPALESGIAALAAEMRANGASRDSPVREIAGMLGDRWTTLILLVLSIGTWRHAELRRLLSQLSAEGNISQRVLTLKLRGLERNGFVSRSATTDSPPKVSYSLTPLGQELAAEARRHVDWVKQRRGAIEVARSAFDTERGKAKGAKG